jgi:hypothetical protein
MKAFILSPEAERDLDLITTYLRTRAVSELPGARSGSCGWVFALSRKIPNPVILDEI